MSTLRFVTYSLPHTVFDSHKGCRNGAKCARDILADTLMTVFADARVTLANYYDSYGFRSRAGFDGLAEDGGPINTAYGKGLISGSRLAVFSGERGVTDGISGKIYSIMGYDVEGHQTQQVSSSIIDGMQIASCTMYTRLGYPNFENTRYNHADGFYETVITHQYDAKGNKTGSSAYLGTMQYSNRAAAEQSQGNNASPQYKYNSLGQLSKLRLINDIDYSYNLRSQMSGISSPVFSQTLSYETGDVSCYNGNISQMSVAYRGGAPVTRKFSYDRLNRLTSQTSTDGYNTAYTYNLNSSPRTIMRRGMMSDGTVGIVDDLALSYDGNRLSSVSDDADPVLLENSLDFPSEYAWFGYNADGNLNMDTSRDITAISYDIGGMPAAIDIFGDDRFEYSYDAGNRKLADSFVESTGRTTTRYYVGALELLKEPGDTVPRLVRANLPWGYMTPEGLVNAYIPDYQGNIRAVIDHTGNAIQTTDYYPYGLPMATSTGAEQNRYKYGGKELETRKGLNFHDFDARMLFNDRVLFNRPDPKAVDYPGFNPYIYCAGNPINIIDPTGEDWIYNEETQEYLWKEDVKSTSDLPDGYRYIGQNTSSVFTDLGLLNNDITKSEYKIGLTFVGNSNMGTLAGTNTYIKSIISLTPKISVMDDGQTLNFKGVEIFGSVTQKFFNSMEDVNLDYKGTINVSQGNQSIGVQLKEPIGENIKQSNTIIRCASVFIPLNNLLKESPINVSIVAGAVNNKVSFLPLPFKMNYTIKY